MKKLLSAVLSLSLLGAAALPAMAAGPEPLPAASPEPEVIAPASEEASAAPGFAIEIDGEQVNARACVMVPLRAIAEKLGFTVAWDSETITVTGSERYLKFTIGRDEYFAAPTQEGMAGASFFSLGCAPCVTDNTTYVPVELFDALLGCKEETVTVENGTIKINTAQPDMSAVQIPSPFIDHATLEEAAQAAGFEMAVPEKAGGSSRRDIQTMDGRMIQVFYGDAGREVCIRKAPGSDDISGDYNIYGQVSTVDVDGLSVTMKGESGLIHLAIWTNGGYTYSVLARAGMGDADMTALIRSVK